MSQDRTGDHRVKTACHHHRRDPVANVVQAKPFGKTRGRYQPGEAVTVAVRVQGTAVTTVTDQVQVVPRFADRWSPGPLLIFATRRLLWSNSS